MRFSRLLRVLCGAAIGTILSASDLGAASHAFAIGPKDFQLDGKPLQIRCGEIHFARVPREYWRNRLQSIRAMGLNAVCAYLFWNFHEWEKGRYEWSGQADAAEFCRLAQEEGLWVILRPGPYACAEWDGGGLPWWLLKNPDVKLRTSDPAFLGPATAWLREVGRVLAPLQVTRGGPILLVQVENEYGSFGDDVEYVGKIRRALIDGGFDVPLFACNPPGDLRKGWRKDLFQVVNFGRDPESGFRALREVQPDGPPMCGEFYPGWFDTWGSPHHLGDPNRYLEDLAYMLEVGGSFSIYMAHGGTSFGLWAGADRPFKPDTSSYDYDAPISEAGWIGEKFRRTRELMTRYLAPGEKLPDPPAPLPVTRVPAFPFTEHAPVFENLPAPITDDEPRPMETYDQGRGCILYRATLPPGPAATLRVARVGDFAWVFVDGRPAGVMDRRERRYEVALPARSGSARLDILVEAMGHVNFGGEIHDRKGLAGPVRLLAARGGASLVPGPWRIYRLGLDAAERADLKWKKGEKAKGPAFWRGSFELERPADTFLDLRKWGKGVAWVNGHCLARYWNIGPTQTAYLPGAWLRAGRNEVVILDLLGPDEPVSAGLEKPILDELHPERDWNQAPARKARLDLAGAKPVHAAAFEAGPAPQRIEFSAPVSGRQFCLEALDAQDGKPFAAAAELDLFDADGQPISHANWSVAYVDSEERAAEDGSVSNALDGQSASYWLTARGGQPGYPHRLVVDLGGKTRIGGFRYVPRAGEGVTGRIKNYRVYVGDALAR